MHTLYLPDIDECTLNSDNCSSNAGCANIDGSYECTCNNGYDGDGVSCSGIKRHLNM